MMQPLHCAFWRQEAVQRPFEAGRPEGRARLAALLRGSMIRAAKAAIRDIPKCLRKVGRCIVLR